MNKRFGGRPALPRNQVRDQRVATFLTAGEMQRLSQLADRYGVSLSHVCHELIVSGLNVQTRKPRGHTAAEGKKTWRNRAARHCAWHGKRGTLRVDRPERYPRPCRDYEVPGLNNSGRAIGRISVCAKSAGCRPKLW